MTTAYTNPTISSAHLYDFVEDVITNYEIHFAWCEIEAEMKCIDYLNWAEGIIDDAKGDTISQVVETLYTRLMRYIEDDNALDVMESALTALESRLGGYLIIS